MLATSGVHHRYRDGTELALPDWEAEEGSHWAVLGPSGSGKTTFIHVLGGFLRPASGTVQVAGTDLTSLSERALDAFRGRHIGMVFQTLHLVDALTIEKNLELAQYLAGFPPDRPRVRGVLDALGITDCARLRPSRVSQGQAQRAALGRAVVNRPSVILADEPTSALDDANCSAVLDLLTGQARECRATLVVATHDRRVRERLDHALDLEVAGA